MHKYFSTIGTPSIHDNKAVLLTHVYTSVASISLLLMLDGNPTAILPLKHIHIVLSSQVEYGQLTCFQWTHSHSTHVAVLLALNVSCALQVLNTSTLAVICGGERGGVIGPSFRTSLF